MGFKYINEEHKIRISLSKQAYIIMRDDMQVFSVSRPATFVNTIIEHYHETSKASLSLYLLYKKQQWEELFENSELDTSSRKTAIAHMVSVERKNTENLLNEYMREKYISKLYHINQTNFHYLTYDCNDEDFYRQKPGAYIKCLLEEYATLPFIERVRIYKKDVFDIVENACKTQSLMRVTLNLNGERQVFHVYPYKILSDPLHAQEYLACFTRKPEEAASEKKDASFLMAKLEKPTGLKQKAFLSKGDKAKIEDDISRLSVSFLLGELQEIHVRLTEQGKQTYQTKLYSRPSKDETRSGDDEYVFFCSEYQAYHYFFPFGPDAEIISPPSLRKQMKQSLQNALIQYG